MVFRICGFFQVFWKKKLVVTKNRVPSIPAKMKNIFWGVEKSFFLQYALKTPYQLWKIDWKAWGTEKGQEKWFSQISIFLFFCYSDHFFSSNGVCSKDLLVSHDFIFPKNKTLTAKKNFLDIRREFGPQPFGHDNLDVKGYLSRFLAKSKIFNFCGFALDFWIF